jgi:hypothetical protein
VHFKPPSSRARAGGLRYPTFSTYRKKKEKRRGGDIGRFKVQEVTYFTDSSTGSRAVTQLKDLARCQNV